MEKRACDVLVCACVFVWRQQKWSLVMLTKIENTECAIEPHLCAQVCVCKRDSWCVPVCVSSGEHPCKLPVKLRRRTSVIVQRYDRSPLCKLLYDEDVDRETSLRFRCVCVCVSVRT